MGKNISRGIWERRLGEEIIPNSWPGAPQRLTALILDSVLGNDLSQRIKAQKEVERVFENMYPENQKSPEPIRPEAKEDDMPLVIKENEGHFEVAPPGLHQAVCVDVVDLGMVDGKFGPKRKLKLIFQLKSKNKQGERFQARASYTQSLMEGSNLRRDLESWRGRAFTDEERKAFDVEKLIGKNCQLNLKHNVSKSTGRTYAQITVILPPVKGADMKPEDYTREPWPTEQPEQRQAEPVYDVEPIDEGHAAQFDDDVPF